MAIGAATAPPGASPTRPRSRALGHPIRVRTASGRTGLRHPHGACRHGGRSAGRWPAMIRAGCPRPSRGQSRGGTPSIRGARSLRRTGRSRHGRTDRSMEDRAGFGAGRSGPDRARLPVHSESAVAGTAQSRNGMPNDRWTRRDPTPESRPPGGPDIDRPRRGRGPIAGRVAEDERRIRQRRFPEAHGKATRDRCAATSGNVAERAGFAPRTRSGDHAASSRPRPFNSASTPGRRPRKRV